MKKMGLYIHIPFCKSKCNYCNFYSYCADENEYNTYIDALISSIIAHGKTYRNRTVDTVYFGGGTPSALGTDRLNRILHAVINAFVIASDAEITFEANPTSADALDFVGLKEAGFNRISFGLQSANDNELKILGRRHTAEEAKEVIYASQNAGFDNLSLDLILCVPEQTKESLKNSIDFAASCGVQHISAYILKIEEGTPFDKIKGSLSLPTDDEQSEIYEYAVNLLEEYGYAQYEISNFAKPGFESRHNLRYWYDEEYLGLGPSAHSFIDGKRFYYPDDIKEFYANNTVFESTGGDSDEYMMLRLRLKEGLNFQQYRERFGKNVDDRIIRKASSLLPEQLVELSDDSLRLTVKGFLVSNAIIAYLLDNT
ncbi:MAG: radical SAM family heme chaperone HemW [Ruminococcus sp.]|nr:radical SAM family heme chaperone HemW [Ruminococcus sp.]